MVSQSQTPGGITMTTKGYWIALLDVTDPERYQAYGEATRPIVARHGGRFLVRGNRSETVSGAARSRIIVIEFPDYETALRCYHLPEYREATQLREAASTGEFVIVEGWEELLP